MKRKRKQFGKGISLLTASAMLVSGIPIQAPVLAAEAPSDTVTALYGTPAIDGEVDDIWDKAPVYSLEQPSVISQATGEVRMLWDDNALYILAEVLDDTPDASSTTAYEQDSVEVFLDELNDKGGSYKSDDVHYRVSYLGSKSVDSGLASRWITATSTFERVLPGTGGTDETVSGGNVSGGDISGGDQSALEEPVVQTGYYVEAAVKWDAIVPQNDTVCGFDVQINAAQNGRRSATVSLFDSTGNAWQNPGMFGEILLTGKTNEDQSGVFPYGLISALEEAEQMDLGIYTESSVQNVLNAIAAGRALLEREDYTQEEIDNALTALEQAIRDLDDGSGMTSPYKLPANAEIPELLTFEDGSRVETAEDWAKRAEEIKALYDYYMYGPMPDTSQETVTYQLGELTEQNVDVTMPDGSKESVAVRKGQMTISVEQDGVTVSFKVTVVLPTTEAPENGYPVFSEMAFAWWGAPSPSGNAYYAASRGYASITWAPTDIAADNSSRIGAFYTLHPYGKSYKEQTGALVAWGWGAGKILDALENGAGEELNIDPVNNILAGVSRYGKATAVAGAYDSRIKVVVPACSGAGGMAMYRYLSQEKTYDLSEFGYVNSEGTPYHLTTANESLGSLQSNDEGHWFNDNFKKFDSVQQFPMDQHYLAALMADPDRYLFIVNGVVGEDWTNPAAMSLTYAAAREAYELLGIGDNINISVHLQGHSINLTDMVSLLDYCDVKLYGKSEEEISSDLREVKTSVYLDDVNYDEEVFGKYIGNNLTDIDTTELTAMELQAANGISEEGLEAMLPSAVRIYVDTVRHMNARVTWDIAGSGYNSAVRKEQKLVIKGQIELPEGIVNPDNIDLEVSVSVTVAELSAEVPYASVIPDGEKEDAWSTAVQAVADKLLFEDGVTVTEGADGTADIRLLWDDAYLYILADIADSDVFIDHGNDEEEDSITVTVAKSVDAGKEVSNYVFTAGGAALKATWNTGGFSAVRNYTKASEVYASSKLTENGWMLEGCIEWAALGIDPSQDTGFALEAVVNSCSSASGKRDYRKATGLTSYPQNIEKYTIWWLTVTYNAGLYAENLSPFTFAAKTGDQTAENIGRYELLIYIDDFEDTFVAPYPVKDSYQEELLTEAREYALSPEATKEGIQEWREKLETMAARIMEDNYGGRMMAKYGTPLVDGRADDKVWENAYGYTTSASKDGQYAEVKSLWDEEAAYVLVKVYDPSYDVTGTDAHTKDSVEFFFLEEADAVLNSYGKNGGQWRINRANNVTVTFGMNEPFYARVTEMEDGSGYVVEARLEFADSLNVEDGYVMNFDVAVNLCANGNRTEAIAWTSTDCYSNPKTSGQIVYLEQTAGESDIPSGYNPYALLKLLDKALIMDREDYNAEDFDAYYNKAALQSYYDAALTGTLSREEIQNYYDAVIAMMSGITYDGVHKSALGFEADHSFPDPFTMNDGSLVTTSEEWTLRHDEIQDLYEFYMYGKLPVAEETGLSKSFSVNEDGTQYTITVSRKTDSLKIEEKSFTFKVYMPEGEAPEGGWPYIINYGGNISGAQSAGYAVIDYSSNGAVAANNSYYQGVFYDMYPECRGDDYVSGVGPLAARAWGAGLIIDCIESGIGELSGLNPANSAVSGFSYLGKTALVTGVLEERIAVTNPAHSGMGGAALLRYSSQGKYYSMDEYPMEDNFLTQKTEPIGQAQGQGAAWVKSIFADFLGSDNTPFDTYMLLSLVAPRGLFVSAGYYDQGTDPEGMYGSYLGACQVYKLLGAEGNIAFADFPTAHANSAAETQAFLQFLDYYFYGTELPEGFYDTVYDNSPDKEIYDVIRIPEKPAVNKDELSEVIAEAEEIDASQYTEESYAALTEALKNAKAVLADEKTGQEEVDAAAEALRKAISELVEADIPGGEDTPGTDTPGKDDTPGTDTPGTDTPGEDDTPEEGNTPGGTTPGEDNTAGGDNSEGNSSEKDPDSVNASDGTSDESAQAAGDVQSPRTGDLFADILGRNLMTVAVIILFAAVVGIPVAIYNKKKETEE